MVSRNNYLKPFGMIFWRMFKKQGWVILTIPLLCWVVCSFFYQEFLAEGEESLIGFLGKSQENIYIATVSLVLFIFGSCFGKEGHKPPYKLYYYPCSSFYLVSSLFISIYLLCSVAITIHLLYMHYFWGYDLLTQRQIIFMAGVYTAALSPYQYGKTPIILSLVSISIYFTLYLLTPISPVLILVAFILTNYFLTVWAFSRSRFGMPLGDWHTLLELPEIDRFIYKFIKPEKNLFGPLMSLELQEKIPANGLLLLAGVMIIILLLPTITWWQIILEVIFLSISLVILSMIRNGNKGRIGKLKKYSLPLSDDYLVQAEIKAYFVRIVAMAIFIAGFFIIQSFSYNPLAGYSEHTVLNRNIKRLVFHMYDYLLLLTLFVVIIGKTPLKILSIIKNKTLRALIPFVFLSFATYAYINTLSSFLFYRETKIYLDNDNCSRYWFILVVLPLAWGLLKLFKQKILPLKKLHALLGIFSCLSVLLILIIYYFMPSQLFDPVCFLSLATLYVILSPLITSPILVHVERHQ